MILAGAFVLFCLVCCVLAFRRHPIWGVYFYFATTYVFPPGRWWGYLFGEFRWALFAAAVTTLAIVFHRGKLQPKPLWIAQGPALILACYAAWMWIQAPFALDVDEHLRGSTEFVKCLLALWFVYRVAETKEGVANLMFAHVLGCGLLGVLAYTIGRSGDRLDGVGGPNIDDANTLGMYLATGAVCGLGLILSQRGLRRYASAAALVFIVNGFVLANSRGPFLGLATGMLVLAFCVARQHRRIFWAMCLVGVVGATVVVDKAFVERMFTIRDVTSQDEAADSSARSRMAIAEAQLQMFLDHPMGTGWRGTVVLSPSYLDPKWLALNDEDNPTRSSHNTFLTALVEGGIIGALIYGCLLIWVLSAARRAWRFSRSGRDPELATLVAALVGSIFVVLAAGSAADYLTKEVQFWLYALLVSGFWLASREVAAPVPVPVVAAPRAGPVPSPRTR